MMMSYYDDVSLHLYDGKDEDALLGGTALSSRCCTDIWSTLGRRVYVWGEYGVPLPEKGHRKWNRNMEQESFQTRLSLGDGEIGG